MKTVFDVDDMINFVRWYDDKLESECHKTYEEELAEFVGPVCINNTKSNKECPYGMNCRNWPSKCDKCNRNPYSADNFEPI